MGTSTRKCSTSAQPRPRVSMMLFASSAPRNPASATPPSPPGTPNQCTPPNSAAEAAMATFAPKRSSRAASTPKRQIPSSTTALAAARPMAQGRAQRASAPVIALPFRTWNPTATAVTVGRTMAKLRPTWRQVSCGFGFRPRYRAGATGAPMSPRCR